MYTSSFSHRGSLLAAAPDEQEALFRTRAGRVRLTLYDMKTMSVVQRVNTDDGALRSYHGLLFSPNGITLIFGRYQLLVFQMHNLNINYKLKSFGIVRLGPFHPWTTEGYPLEE